MALFFFPAEQSAMVLPCFQQFVVVVIVLVVEDVETKNNLFFLILMVMSKVQSQFYKLTCYYFQLNMM